MQIHGEELGGNKSKCEIQDYESKKERERGKQELEKDRQTESWEQRNGMIERGKEMKSEKERKRRN